jgi:hypothetical protein
MREALIASLWKHHLKDLELETVDARRMKISHPGIENPDAGPDFLAARIYMDGLLWVGNVEIHVCASDWYRHGHHRDKAYDNVILHLVWSADTGTVNSRGKPIPLVEIGERVDLSTLQRIEQHESGPAPCPCRQVMQAAGRETLTGWLERLLKERLAKKQAEIARFHHYFGQDWARTFHYFLARNFGFRTNAVPFGLLAQKTPQALLLKHRNRALTVEAMLFGQAGFLEERLVDSYPRQLQTEYTYRRKAHRLSPIPARLWRFARLRPANFPTIRLSQFAGLVSRRPHLFRECMEAQAAGRLRTLFTTRASGYWDDHYLFDKPSPFHEKWLGASATDNLIINTVVPMLWYYGEAAGKPVLRDRALSLLRQIPPEANAVMNHWKKMGAVLEDAGDSQALLEAARYCCLPRRCLGCAIGLRVMGSH